MQAEHLAGRYITANPRQWPQTFQQVSTSIPMGTYGHSLPFSLEDTMYLFDRLGRLHPLSIHYFCLGTSTGKQKQQAKSLTPHLIDRFFCAYLARYLNIPFYFFKVSFGARSSTSEFTTLSNSDDLKHFSLYLDKNASPNQGQVKQWIRQVYL